MRISDWSSDVCSSDLVWLAIADRKTRLMKTRIYLSLKAFMKDGDGAMLVDRLRVLAGNYRINRRGINAVRRSRRSEEHTSELQSLMRISYAVFCLKKKKNTHEQKRNTNESSQAK